MRSAMAIAVQLVNHEYRSHEPAGRMPRHKRSRDRKRFKVFQPREGPCLAGPSTWQRASGDIDAKLEQFAVDAGCTPERVSQAHVPDQLTDLRRHSRSPAAPSGFLPTPERSQARAVC